MKSKTYYVDILNHEYWVCVFVGKSKKLLKKKLDRHFESKINEITGTEDDRLNNIRGSWWGLAGYAPFIWVNLNNCPTERLLYATLAHEAVHAVEHIFDRIGEKSRDEAYAHSVAAIVRGY